MRFLSFFIVTLALAAAFSSCGLLDKSEDSSSEELLNSVPDWEQFKITVGPSRQARLDLAFEETPTAQFYLFTRLFVDHLNPVVYGLLLGVEVVVHFPPTRSEGDTHVWEPDQPASGLDATIPRFTLTKTAARHYSYTLETRPKEKGREAYVKVWWGDMILQEGHPRRGTGTMTLDFDAAASVDPGVVERGQAVVVYDISAGKDRVIRIHFDQFHGKGDPEGQKITADYNYLSAVDHTGSFKFSTYSTLLNLSPGSTPAAALWMVETRWQADGQGQALATVAGSPDLNALGLMSYEARECWNSLFKETYYSEFVTWDPDRHPEWVSDGKTNPLEMEGKQAGDPAQCPYGFTGAK